MRTQGRDTNSTNSTHCTLYYHKSEKYVPVSISIIPLHFIFELNMIIEVFLYIILLILLLLIKLNQHFSLSSTTNSITLAILYRNQSVHLSTLSSKSIFSEEYGLLLKSVPYPYIYHIELPFILNSVYPVITFKIKNEEKRRSAYFFYENELWLVIISFFV